MVNAVYPLIGGVVLVGDKGTGKSTLVRAFAQVLPAQPVAKGCPFNCNPFNPLEMCDYHYDLWAKGEKIEYEFRKIRVVDLPLNATPDRVAGSIDIEKTIKSGKVVFKPGLLAEANRNVLYIDEVNLLEDYIADLILDAAASGWNVVERESVSFKHPARFILAGSMNPEEGMLRPQILDRFGLYVPVEASMSSEERVEIVERVEEFARDPESFYRKWEPMEKQVEERIARARKIIRDVAVDRDLLKLVTETVIKLGIKTHRAEIVTIRTAKAIAALDGRTKVNLNDVVKAMELALRHRLKSKPFEQPQRKFEDIVKELIGKKLEQPKQNREISSERKGGENFSGSLGDG
ncbi:MAG: magnesium chelatase, partial [Thermoprotei archaeon]